MTASRAPERNIADAYPRWTLVLTMGMLLVVPAVGLLLFAGWWYAVYGLAQNSLIAANLGARAWRRSSLPKIVRGTWCTLVLAVVATGISVALATPIVFLVPAASATLVAAFALTMIAQDDK
jgi:ABC-type phosphate/phosphonate transport system permease subunit